MRLHTAAAAVEAQVQILAKIRSSFGAGVLSPAEVGVLGEKGGGGTRVAVDDAEHRAAVDCGIVLGDWRTRLDEVGDLRLQRWRGCGGELLLQPR